MDLRRCYQILELDRKASIEEVRRAYKDMVSIWHPDRFSHNPRLKQKAEKKLKEINNAYEAIRSSLDSRKGAGVEGDRGGRDVTEAVAEAGTRLVLNLWSHLSKGLRRALDNQFNKTGRKP